MNQITTFPSPGESESYEDFVIRAHNELFAAIPEPMDRNRAIWNAWETQNGDPERYRATKHFPPEHFTRKEDVCHWHEHIAVSYDASGNPVEKNNDVHRIIDIMRENNGRIADSDSYPAVVDGHTPQLVKDPKTGQVKKEDKPAPATLAFTGPFRLGMIGRKKPRFATFADEYHRNEKRSILADRPRRSVEVLTLKANGRSYFDPIAALSESPRLPLPLSTHYAAGHEEFDREYYEAVNAYPGGNTYIPGGGESRKQKPPFSSSPSESYSGGTTSSNQVNPMFENQTGGNAAPDQTRVIVDAIMATPLMKFMMQFAESQGFNQGGQAAAKPQAQADQFSGMQGMVPGMPGAMQYGSGPNMRYGASETESSSEYQGAVDGALHDFVLEAPEEVSVEQFSALAAQVQSLMSENANLKHNQVQLTSENTDAKRRAELDKLHSKFPHFVDLESEQSACLYSAGSQMNDEMFADHMTRLQTYAEKAPPVTNATIPGGASGVAPPEVGDVETAQYEASVSARSLEIYTAEMAAGNVLTPDQAYAAAEKEIAGTAG